MKEKKFLSQGAGRRVYDTLDGNILKVAYNKKGVMECNNEWYIYNHVPEKYKKYLCPVINIRFINGKARRLIMPKIITAKEYAAMNFIRNFNKGEAVDAVFFLKKEFNVDDYEILEYEFNWGFINNDPVILDYGSNIFQEML